VVVGNPLKGPSNQIDLPLNQLVNAIIDIFGLVQNALSDQRVGTSCAIL
jgi:hypothetical protein